MGISVEPRAFDFRRDTFAFPNELVWEYRLDPRTGRMVTRPNVPPPRYAHHCFVMARSARQFRYHARFDPAVPALADQDYRALVRAVVSRNPRWPGLRGDLIPIAGFEGLREFSQTHADLLKAECGGHWQSYFVRSHWRMVFPVTRRHQRRQADALLRSVRGDKTPIVHLFRFPQLTINHAVTLIGAEDRDPEIEFSTYDPNLPDAPSTLVFRRADRTFRLPPNKYWAGGRVDVVESYRGWLY